MGHTRDFVLVIGACEILYLVTPVHDYFVHLRLCLAHAVVDICGNQTCEICLGEGFFQDGNPAEKD